MMIKAWRAYLVPVISKALRAGDKNRPSSAILRRRIIDIGRHPDR